jgi:hypothetical protein
LRWIRSVTVAGWSRRNEKVVPRGLLRVVRLTSGGDLAPTLNTGCVCKSAEIVSIRALRDVDCYARVHNAESPADPGSGEPIAVGRITR